MKRILLIAFVALQVLDVTTTQHFLANGHGVEGNPIFAAIMAHTDLWWLVKLAITLGVVLPVLAVGRVRYAAIMVAFYALVVVNNLVL
jgi:hypothetical protein